MATIDLVDQLTIVELAKRINNNKLLKIAEVLAKKIPVFKDAIWGEANQPTSHVHNRRLSLPSGSLRGVNEGVDEEASLTRQVVEDIMYLEGQSKVDELLAKLAPDQKAFRFSEDLAFIEGLSQTAGKKLLYGDHATDPREVNGLATRYYDPTNQSESVQDCGGDGSNVTSVYFIKWGLDSVFLCYPRNSKTIGVEQNDMGLLRVLDSNNKPFFAWVTQFIFNWGLVVRDDRCVQRIGSIETTGSTNTFDEDLGIQALNNMPDTENVVMYCNKTIKTQLEIIAKDKPNVLWQDKDAFGKPITRFREVPVRIWDSPINTEDAI